MRVPKWLLQLIDKCLEKDPEKRFVSGMALQDALFEGSLSMEQEPVSAVQPQKSVEVKSSDSSWKAADRAYIDSNKMLISKPLFFALMGLFFLALLTCGYLWIDQNRQGALETKIAADTVAKPAPDTTKKGEVGTPPPTVCFEEKTNKRFLIQQAVLDAKKADKQHWAANLPADNNQQTARIPPNTRTTINKGYEVFLTSCLFHKHRSIINLQPAQ